MPTIKPASFPQAERTLQPRPEQQLRQPGPNHASAPVRVRTQPGIRPGQRVQPPAGARQASPARQAGRDQKLKQAVDVLRAKSIELYEPSGAKVRRSPRLGQLIDIKA